ncbi:MAG: type III-B CRISPR module RAMP protein Cmr6 [Lewinellaceae bacterium]|nr:type III-B CRISPR module RAMP protein Cmr6 [Lewinellaceae bacterium]
MNKFQFFKRERKGENFEIKENYGNVDFEQIAEREYANARGLLGDNNIHRLRLTTDWRMVQGLGIESVYETSLTLHHVYGIPYIPASALKGVVRSWVITEEYETNEGAAIREQKFCDWFGCPGEIIDGKKQKFPSYYKEARQGNLVFFDVFPLAPPKIVVDVMNPHYQPYYSDNSGKTPPADYLSPNPVFFLTIANTPFQVIVGGRNKEILRESIGGKNIQFWLQAALTSHGIGAKTAVGYGYLKPS